MQANPNQIIARMVSDTSGQTLATSEAVPVSVQKHTTSIIMQDFPASSSNDEQELSGQLVDEPVNRGVHNKSISISIPDIAEDFSDTRTNSEGLFSFDTSEIANIYGNKIEIQVRFAGDEYYLSSSKDIQLESDVTGGSDDVTVDFIIEDADVTPMPDAYSVEIIGTISGGNSDPAVKVDWDDGTSTYAEGENWSAAHEYDLEHAGTEKTVNSSLTIAGSPTPISTDYEILIPDPPVTDDEIAFADLIVIGSAVTAAGGGTILATKSKPFKNGMKSLKEKLKKKDPGKNDPYSVRIDLRYGIENLKEINAQMQNYQTEGAVAEQKVFSHELEEEFKSVLGSSLKDIKNTMQHAKQAKEMLDFCSSAKQNPDKFLTEMADRGFSKIIDEASPFLASMLVSQLSIKSHIETGYSDRDNIAATNNDDAQVRKAMFDVDIEMQPIRPFIEAVLLVNNTPIKVATIIFQFDISAAIRKAGLILSENGAREWKIEGIKVNISQ